MLSALGTFNDGAGHSGGGVPECRDRSTSNGHRTPCRRHAQAVGRGEARNVPTFMVSGSAIPPPLVEHARGSQAGARTAIDCAHSRYVRHPFRWLRASVLWGARSGDDVSTSILADFASGWNKIPASPRRLPARTRPASRSPRKERVQPRAAVRAGPRPAPRDPDLGHGVRCVSDAVLVDGYMRRPGKARTADHDRAKGPVLRAASSVTLEAWC